MTHFLLPRPNLPNSNLKQCSSVWGYVTIIQHNSFQRSHAFVFCGKVWRVPKKKKKNYNSSSPLWSLQSVELKHWVFFFISHFILPCQNTTLLSTRPTMQLNLQQHGEAHRCVLLVSLKLLAPKLSRGVDFRSLVSYLFLAATKGYTHIFFFLICSIPQDLTTDFNVENELCSPFRPQTDKTRSSREKKCSVVRQVTPGSTF